jgi:hypothetical protein
MARRGTKLSRSAWLAPRGLGDHAVRGRFQIGDSLLTEPSALLALTTWMHAATRHAAAYRGLAAMLADGAGNEESELHESCLRMASFTEKLTTRAQEAGVIGRDITATDVSALISAAAWTAERTCAEDAGRLLELAVNGMRNAG